MSVNAETNGVITAQDIEQIRATAQAQLAGQSSFVQEALKKQQQLEQSGAYNQAVDYAKDYGQAMQQMQRQSNQEQPMPHAFIAVTLSMPMQALRMIVQQADMMGVPVYINGLVQDNMELTHQKILEIFTKDLPQPLDGGIAIDPRVFTKFNIKFAPAYIAVGIHCTDEDESCDPNTYDVVTGSITPITAFKMIAEKGEAGKAAAQQAIKNYVKNGGNINA